jgi:hypothetical protein
MNSFFLIKEHNYEKIDGSFRGQDRVLLPTSYASYDDAVKDAQVIPQQFDDVVYVVQIVAKCFGGSSIKIDSLKTKSCSECGWPEHEGKCGTEALSK